MKVCFIGACGHSASALNYLKTRQDVTFCGFAQWDKREPTGAYYVEHMPFYDDARRMLDETKPDLAIISPIFGLTAEVIIECASRGIDVFSEKPVATSLEDLEKVIKTVKENNVRFCAMHYLRYDPAFYHAAQMVKDGRIGSVKMITAQKSYRYGTRPDWYKDRKLYGGTIPWVGIHAIDWISAFSNKRFLSVTGLNVNRDPEMAALCQFQLEDDIIASINVDFYRPQGAPSHGDDRVRCVGDAGVIEVCGGKISLMDQNGTYEYCPDTAPELMELFLAGKEVITPEEIFHITKAAILARDAADSGKTLIIGE